MSGTPPAEGKPRKSLWDTILTATPVVLTVLATLLAGMSSSEMTQAQYHRSLAAQNQSKAGDQWGLFQAKRIRGTNLEMTVELLRNTSNPGPVSPDDVKRAAAQLAGALARGDRQAKELQKAVAAGGGSGAAVKRAADDLAAAAPKLAGRARKLQQDADAALAKMTSADAFAYLSAGRLPAVEDTPVEDERINEALRAIAERKTEHQNEPLLRRISDADVEKALDVALANERAFDRATGPATEAQAVLDRVLKEEAALARDFQDRVEEVQAALADAPAGADSAAARTAAANLERTANAAARAAGRAQNRFAAARLDFTARRYLKEARYNQAIAGLYEVQVQKSSVESDRHRTRSKHFFYGMLAAQAGVTIASFSLAVRFRSALWGLACLAGLAALGIAAYVYMNM